MQLKPLLMIFLLSGCAATGPKIDRVEIPVSVPCVKQAELPTPPQVAAKPTSDFQQKNAALIEYTMQLEAYSARMRAKLEACAIP